MFDLGSGILLVWTILDLRNWLRLRFLNLPFLEQILQIVALAHDEPTTLDSSKIVAAVPHPSCSRHHLFFAACPGLLDLPEEVLDQLPGALPPTCRPHRW